jgi:uncharacterized protein (DUF433 family)
MQQFAIIDRGRGPELAGTRLTVYDIIPFLEAGRSPTYIAACFGQSTFAVQFMIEYIERHRDEVMAVHRQIEERIARGNPPEILERLRRSPTHAIIEARLAEIRKKRAREGDNGEGNPGGH